MDPCAILPNVSISAHQTPLCPRHILFLLSGSGIITLLTFFGEKYPSFAKNATPPYPPVSSSAVNENSIRPGYFGYNEMKLSTAIIDEAIPPFMSQAPRP